MTEIPDDDNDIDLENQQPSSGIKAAAKLNQSCMRDSPTIEQRMAELKSNGLLSGHVTAVSGSPSGATSYHSSLADPVGIKKSKQSNQNQAWS